jgi:hypothetical protein
MNILGQSVPPFLQVVLLCLVNQGPPLKFTGRILNLMFCVCMRSSLSCLIMFRVIVDCEASMRIVSRGN